MKSIYYTLLDYKDGEDDEGYPTLDTTEINKEVYAYKKESADGSFVYFVKHDNAGSLVIPQEENLSKGRLMKALSEQNPQSFFRKVTEETFKQYLSFLKTKNKRDYKLANRSSI